MCNYRVHYYYNKISYHLDFSISCHVGSPMIKSEAYRQILRKHKEATRPEISIIDITPIEIW